MFALTGKNLPTVRSYQDALGVFEGAWKGTHNDWRGINTNNKRDSSKLVLKRSDGSVAFRYHHTELVTWHDNKTVSIDFHGSQSSATFISAFTPSGLDPHRSNDTLYMRTSGDKYWTNKGRQGVAFTFCEETRGWLPDMADVAMFHAFNIDLKKAAAVRKLFKPFLEWKKSMERLGTTFYPSDRNLTTATLALKEWIRDGVPEGMYRVAAESALGDQFLRNAYVLAGAVEKIDDAPGVLPRKSPYESLVAWNHI